VPLSGPVHEAVNLTWQFSIVQKPTEAVLVRLAPQLKKNVTDLARENRRPRAEEIRIALERHVAASKARSA
jgi:hypothetical protein